jgi:hypothetical protein
MSTGKSITGTSCIEEERRLWDFWNFQKPTPTLADLFPSTLPGDRGCVSPLGTGVAKPAGEGKG